MPFCDMTAGIEVNGSVMHAWMQCECKYGRIDRRKVWNSCLDFDHFFVRYIVLRGLFIHSPMCAFAQKCNTAMVMKFRLYCGKHLLDCDKHKFTINLHRHQLRPNSLYWNSDYFSIYVCLSIRWSMIPSVWLKTSSNCCSCITKCQH